MTEKTGAQILEQLKRIADALERSPWTQPIAPPPPTPWPTDPNRCGMCGGNHFGLQCPMLNPIAVAQNDGAA